MRSMEVNNILIYQLSHFSAGRTQPSYLRHLCADDEEIFVYDFVSSLKT
jgi:hypothetical protein